MSNLITLTDRAVLDQQDHLREARQRALVREVKANRRSNEQKVRRHRASTRLIQRFAA
ncbi:hypothetical protein [Nocardioides speluncae]|uniref:hypothetical protein n=1 Tax=Nocardioides speluncae TaxID=2670337 RepID=UPI0012B16CA5|nr:hypothetical protein [Nocardioides speluncae]